MRAGDVVLMDFPYSDLSGSKLRPAVVLAVLDRADVIACQITSQAGLRPEQVQLSSRDFTRGGLPMTSYAMPGKLFTANASVVQRRVGRLIDSVRDELREAAIRLLRRN